MRRETPRRGRRGSWDELPFETEDRIPPDRGGCRGLLAPDAILLAAGGAKDAGNRHRLEWRWNDLALHRYGAEGVEGDLPPGEKGGLCGEPDPPDGVRVFHAGGDLPQAQSHGSREQSAHGDPVQGGQEFSPGELPLHGRIGGRSVPALGQKGRGLAHPGEREGEG